MDFLLKIALDDTWSKLIYLCSSSECDITMLKILLKLNKNIDSQEEKTHKTLLMYACSSNNKNSHKIVAEILKFNPDIELTDVNGYTVIDYANYQGNNKTIQLLYNYPNPNKNYIITYKNYINLNLS